MRYPLDRMIIRTHQMGVYKPLSNTYGRWVRGKKAHQGWDLAAAPGTSVYAITYGQAEAMPYHGDWGNWVRLAFLHKGRTHYAFYCHLSYSSVGRGCSVVEGSILGVTGMTGNAALLCEAEAHLHFGVATVPNPRKTGSADRILDYIDPGEVLGYEVYRSSA